MNSEPSRLIPRKLAANQELSIFIFKNEELNLKIRFKKLFSVLLRRKDCSQCCKCQRNTRRLNSLFIGTAPGVTSTSCWLFTANMLISNSILCSLMASNCSVEIPPISPCNDSMQPDTTYLNQSCTIVFAAMPDAAAASAMQVFHMMS